MKTLSSSASVHRSTPWRTGPKPAAGGPFTLGLDLGDRRHRYCVLDAASARTVV